jgi:hypothetical protein
MGNSVEMQKLFFYYLNSRLSHCETSLFNAIKQQCRITSCSDGFVWDNGHFSFHAFQSMMYMKIRVYENWNEVKNDPDFPMCLNQVVKEINRVNGPHDHFLAFFELYTCKMWNNCK